MKKSTIKLSFVKNMMTGVCITFAFVLVVMFVVIWFRVGKTEERNFEQNSRTSLEVADIGINTYFESIQDIIESFSRTEVINDFSGSVTSYLNKSASVNGQKIPMDPNNFGPYEKRVDQEAQKYFSTFDSIIDVCVATTKNAGYYQYPYSARSEHYDPTTRSWYKEAVSNNGKIGFSDAYVASDGTKSIIASKSYNDNYGNLHGVIAMDINLDRLTEILSTKNSESAKESYIVTDKTGTVIINQFAPEKEFVNIKDLGIDAIKNYSGGELETKNANINGQKYDIIAFSSSNEFVPLNYIVIIPRKYIRSFVLNVLSTLMICTIIAIAIGIVTLYILIVQVGKPLTKITEMLKSISEEEEGDLSARIEITGGFGKGDAVLMARYFNKTLEKIQTSIIKVKSESENMQKLGTVLSDNMNETAAAANQITSNINSVTHEVQMQSDNVKSADSSVQEINKNVENLINNIESQSSCVVESSSAIEEMVANIRSVTKILETNGNTISSLEKSSEEGKTSIATSVTATEKIREQSKILLDASNVIQNIASQTNLLAMNAAIEAAHAGESGKGFSVVADEIRKLAEDSNTQGKKITENLKDVLETIEDIGKSSASLQAKFNEIYDLTQKVSEQELTIMHAMQEQSEGGGQVLEAMKEINDITVNVKTGGSQMQSATTSVNNEMSSLIRITNEITASMNEMEQGINNINKSINEVNDLTHQNSQSIENLNDVVRTFKV